MRKPPTTYTTKPAESIMGIALRELVNEKRWTEIRDLNAEKFPDMTGADYYPVGTVITMPEVDLKRQAEMKENAEWWRKISNWRVNGFDIKETDPMFAKINERYKND